MLQYKQLCTSALQMVLNTNVMYITHASICNFDVLYDSIGKVCMLLVVFKGAWYVLHVQA